MPPRNILLTLTRIWIPYNGNKLSGRHYDLRLQDTVFTVHGDLVQITTENLTSVQPWSEIFLFRYFCSLTFCLCVLTRIVLKNWHIFKTYLSKNWHLPQTPDNWIVRKLRKCSRVWILSTHTHTEYWYYLHIQILFPLCGHSDQCSVAGWAGRCSRLRLLAPQSTSARLGAALIIARTGGNKYTGLLCPSLRHFVPRTCKIFKTVLCVR